MCFGRLPGFFCEKSCISRFFSRFLHSGCAVVRFMNLCMAFNVLQIVQFSEIGWFVMVVFAMVRFGLTFGV